MILSANLRHFLDEDGNVVDVTPEARQLLDFLGDIVEIATITYGSAMILADTPCRMTINGKRCPGELEVWVYAEDNKIGWECQACGDEGIISGWEGTPWDRRDYVCH